MLSLELSLNDVEEMYRVGRVREEEVEDYIRRWNEKLRFTMAVLRDGRIREYEAMEVDNFQLCDRCLLEILHD